MKDLEYYLSLRYKIEIIPDEAEDGYVAQYPELRGCITCAEDIQTVIKMLDDAKRAWITAALEDGYPIPEPGVDLQYEVFVTLHIDNDIKKRAERLFAHLGLDMNTAINIFLRKAVEENGIPFLVSEKTLSDSDKTVHHRDSFMKYRGYVGYVEYSDKKRMFHGQVLCTEDQVLFEGDSVHSLKENFHNAVDDYLEVHRKGLREAATQIIEKHREAFEALAQGDNAGDNRIKGDINETC